MQSEQFHRLAPCVYCGHLLSPSARQCPKCEKGRPKGVVCHYCASPMPVEAATCLHHLYFHAGCLTKHFTVPASVVCPDCGRSLAILGALWTTDHTCPHCGAEAPLAQGNQSPILWCGSCRLPIFTSFHEYRLGAAVQTYSSLWGVAYHSFCVEIDTVAKADVELRQRQAEQRAFLAGAKRFGRVVSGLVRSR